MPKHIKIILALRIILSIEVLLITVIFAFTYIQGKAGPVLIAVLILSWAMYILMYIKSRKLLNMLGNMKDEELDEVFGKPKSVTDYANINSEEDAKTNVSENSASSNDDSEKKAAEDNVSGSDSSPDDSSKSGSDTSPDVVLGEVESLDSDVDNNESASDAAEGMKEGSDKSDKKDVEDAWNDILYK
ncbi:MAG: hypothetical protein K6G11_07640 [Lachnospiraceae bacterium]|nr:hypothetical protein [Lachnospiraceae bacterium]